jgi:outer membrane protein TolC
MPLSFPTWRRYRTLLLRGLAVPAVACLAPWAAAADAPAPLPAVAVAPAQAQVLDLAACRQIALQRQPAIAAAQASLDAAQARADGLERQHAVPLVARDLPVRRQQANLGVAIAQAQLEQARWETTYSVTRTYWSVVFAQQQLRVVDDTLARLRDLKKDTDEAGNWVRDQIPVYMKVAQGRRETASSGVERALAALREAMGVGGDFPCFAVADAELPLIPLTICREEIVRLALARRGELVQATAASEVTGHEVEAQSKFCLRPTARTFASGSDLHAHPVPQGTRNGEYRPGAVGLEMPPFLVGSRSARVEQAKALSARAGSVVDKTRSLVALEADDAYLRWLEDSRKLPLYEEAADEARKLADKLQKDVKVVGAAVTYADAIGAGLTATQLRVQANEARYQLLLDLAALERVTAGGFCAGFEAPPSTRP